MMAVDGVIFDLDGTLVDTNAAHARAFAGAFEEAGYRVGVDRLAQEIGKGGVYIVPQLLGDEAEAAHGDAIRAGHDERYLALIEAEGAPLLPGAVELLKVLRERGLQTAISTGAKRKAVEQVMRHADVDLTEHVDDLVTDTDVERSKPNPDTVTAAVEKLGLSPAQCVMVGDTPWDAKACRRAGVVLLGVRTGVHSDERMRRAGTRAVYDHAGDLLAHLDEALALASPGAASLTSSRLDALMQEAMTEARSGLNADERPIGSVIARANGTVVARGRSQMRQKKSRIAHAEMEALTELAGHEARTARDLVLVTTLEPCVMGLGAAVEAGIDTIVYALEAPHRGGPSRCPSIDGKSMPRLVSGPRASESRRLLATWHEHHPEDEAIGTLLKDANDVAVEAR